MSPPALICTPFGPGVVNSLGSGGKFISCGLCCDPLSFISIASSGAKLTAPASTSGYLVLINRNQYQKPYSTGKRKAPFGATREIRRYIQYGCISFSSLTFIFSNIAYPCCCCSFFLHASAAAFDINRTP